MTTINTKEEQKIVNAYLYSRVSSGKQVSGAGLTRQDDRGLQICKEKGWILQPDSLSDVGSAYKGDNLLKGALGKFIQAAKEGRIMEHSVLILEQWDRFSRQDLDSSFNEAANLLRMGVAIHIGFGGGKTFTKIDLQNIASRVSMEISMQQAYEYSHNLSKRINDSFQRKYQQASEGKAVQLGHKQPAWVDFIGEKKQVGKFILNDTAKVIQGMVDDYLNGESMFKIAKRLNFEKVPCVGNGKKWFQGGIQYLLRSETLIGNITINGNRYEHYYPAVISDEKWKLLQDRLSLNKDSRGGNREGNWISTLFPNRAICACCGGSIKTCKSGRVKKIRYYLCSTSRIDPTKCQVKRLLPINRIEEDFFMLFLKKNPVELVGKDTPQNQVELAKINEQIRKLEKEQEDATELIGKFPVKAIEKKLAIIQKSMEAHLEAKEKITKSMMATDSAPTVFADIKKALTVNDWDTWEQAVNQVHDNLQKPEVRKQMVQLLPRMVDHLTIDLEAGEYTITTTDGKTSTKRSVVGLPTV